MKSNLTKLSLALLSAVFILGCQDLGSGPVEAVDLVPQFDKKDFTSGRCDGVDPIDGHCHDHDVVVEEPTDTFTIKVTGDIFTTNDDGDMGVVYEAFGGGPRAVDVQLKLSLDMRNAVTCGLADLDDPLIGNLVFGNFLIDAIALNFDHNLAQHHFSSHTELPDSPWPPLPGTTVTVGPDVELGSGEWGIQTKGKNHRDGCTGEGVGIEWTAVVKNITGTR